MPRIATIGAAASGAFGFQTNSLIPVDYLIVGGGGGGGTDGGGGGGAGGLLTSSFVLTAKTLYSITIGNGGAAGQNISDNGTDSTFNGLTAIGGGFGGKLPIYLDPVVALLSKKSGKPVQIAMSRTEVFEATGPTSGTNIKVKMAAKGDKITAVQASLARFVAAK